MTRSKPARPRRRQDPTTTGLTWCKLADPAQKQLCYFALGAALEEDYLTETVTRYTYVSRNRVAIMCDLFKFQGSQLGLQAPPGPPPRKETTPGFPLEGSWVAWRGQNPELHS